LGEGDEGEEEEMNWKEEKKWKRVEEKGRLG
jgi:hypothetical protein